MKTTDQVIDELIKIENEIQGLQGKLQSLVNRIHDSQTELINLKFGFHTETPNYGEEVSTE